MWIGLALCHCIGEENICSGFFGLWSFVMMDDVVVWLMLYLGNIALIDL